MALSTYVWQPVKFDPVKWQLEAKQDDAPFVPVHVQKTRHATPTERDAQLEWFAVLNSASTGGAAE